MNDFQLQSLDYTNVSNYTENCEDNRTLEEIYYESIVVANNKAHNLEQWKISPSSYLIDKFLNQFNNDKVAVFNFKVDGKIYLEEHIVFNESIEYILENFSINFNKRNAFSYKNNLSKQLFSIFMDYLNNYGNKFNIINNTNEKLANLNFESKAVEANFSARFKNFERDLLINKYPKQQEDIDNKELRDLIFASSEVFYVTSSRYLFILTYTPTNEQYYNDKIKDINKAPEFSFMIYDREIEDFFIDNFKEINLFHSNFMQFIYSSDMNQNVANAMGESSLISQHWYTKSVEKILKDHEEELKKSKDSKLLVEYIIRYILAAEIEGVNFIEVYPFDRVFVFNEAIDFSNKNNNDKLKIEVAEGLLESKITHKEINDKEFLGGKTRYAYEWERIKAKIEIEKFNPSKKKLKFISSELDKIEKVHSDFTWIEPYDKDIDTVLNNFINTFTSKDKKNDNMLLEYQSKYVNNNIVYLYSSGSDLKTQMPAIYNLQKDYLKQIKEDKADGIKKINYEALYESDDFNFDNAKVVLFSYVPEEDNAKKGFTILLIANQDVKKSTMEQKSEKEDLYTALKLLVNQHFTIDEQYKKKSEKEQKELIDILSQTEHSLKNSFDEFIKDEANFNREKLKQFQEKVLNLISQDRQQMEDYGRNAQEIQFSQSIKNPLLNSLSFIKRLMSSSSSDTKESSFILNRKFTEHSNNPWDVFAKKIFSLDIKDLKENRIQEFIWESSTNPKQRLYLKIDFNELQDFNIEFKESLYNDAIYVMLKNACEHSLETMTKGDMQKEIFLDIYISSQFEQDTLNIEFTNNTKPLCKEMFEHINKGIIQKDNKNKENSTGIGVVTIRKRLDVTYGLDKSNITFIIVGKDKIKSRLYVPINTIYSNTMFLPQEQCSQSTNILYLEDESQYFKQNITLLEQNNIICDHFQGYDSNIDFSKYDILLTDLNIFAEDDSSYTSATNGEDAIADFIEENPQGTVVIFSTDKFNNIHNNFNIVSNITDIQNFDTSTIYKANMKIFPQEIIEPLAKVYDNTETIVSVVPSQTTITNINKVINKYDDFTKIIYLKELDDVNELDKINGHLIMADNDNIVETINKWEQIKVKNKNDRERSISNSEIPNEFLTRLIIKVDNIPDEIMPAIMHESLRKNILFVKLDFTEEQIKQIANNSKNYIMAKKGTLRQLDHDIISKMHEFGNYTDKEIIYIKHQKDNLAKQFLEIFDNFINDVKIKDTNIKTLYNTFLKELHKLQKDALTTNNHLGSTLSKLQNHIQMLEYLAKGNL